jgi:hypothetical protein
MKRLLLLIALCAACTSAEEKEQRRKTAMIEAAKEDSTAEADFVQDSVTLAASITVDSVAQLLTVREPQRDEDDNEFMVTRWVAVSPKLTRCLLDSTRYTALVAGDTLSCQWGPPQ